MKRGSERKQAHGRRARGCGPRTRRRNRRMHGLQANVKSLAPVRRGLRRAILANGRKFVHWRMIMT
jgi:hypothetical protein